MPFSCKRYKQMGEYAREPLPEGKQTTGALNHGFSALLRPTE
jgi:hypothetical protein